MNIFKRARLLYVLNRHGIRHRLWEASTRRLPLLQGMTTVEKTRLRELSTLFLHEKNICGVQGLQLTKDMRVMIAAQACLPILDLGLALLSGWRDVIVYPAVFRVARDETDAFGIVHHDVRLLSGESWTRGPLILSWHTLEQDMRSEHPGHNVIVHEIAHKLDCLNGSANGMPPLHASMPTTQWTDAFSKAFEQLNRQLSHHQHTCIDPYAATSPAECFAVFSEYFFCAPELLMAHYAAVYRQLKLYYRQDPLRRLTTRSESAESSSHA